MDKWEYMVEVIVTNKKIDRRKLGKLGREGWELVILWGNEGIFKRKVR